MESSEESKNMDSNGESETMDLSFVTDLLLKEVQIPPLSRYPRIRIRQLLSHKDRVVTKL